MGEISSSRINLKSELRLTVPELMDAVKSKEDLILIDRVMSAVKKAFNLVSITIKNIFRSLCPAAKKEVIYIKSFLDDAFSDV